MRKKAFPTNAMGFFNQSHTCSTICKGFGSMSDVNTRFDLGQTIRQHRYSACIVEQPLLFKLTFKAFLINEGPR